MPLPVPSGPPLPSRAVLLIGALALACLALLAALAFEAAEGEAPPALDARAAALPATSPATPPTLSAAASADPEPIPSTVLIALEQAAEEPLDVELARLLDALQHGFGEASAQVEPTLRPYAFRLAGRLNVRSASFAVRVAAPDSALAEARSEVLRRLFEAAGAVPGRLRFAARRGAPALTAEPA